MTATLLVRRRRRHGATGHRVLHDGNQVTILIDFPDRGLTEGFASGPTLPEVMSKAGVVGAPAIASLVPSGQLSY
jgi:hypothetical protein